MGRGIHKKLRAILGGKGDSLPDERRAGHNLSYRLSDAHVRLCQKHIKVTISDTIRQNGTTEREHGFRKRIKSRADAAFTRQPCVGEDNPVRVIDAFVNGLEMHGLGFAKAAPKDTGRPSYDPKDMLKLYVYGYMYRVRSSRRLETETKRNPEGCLAGCRRTTRRYRGSEVTTGRH